MKIFPCIAVLPWLFILEGCTCEQPGNHPPALTERDGSALALGGLEASDIDERRLAAADLCIEILKKNGVWRTDPLNWKILTEEEIRLEVCAVKFSDQPEELAVPNMCADCIGMLKVGSWAAPPLARHDELETAIIKAAQNNPDAVVRTMLLLALASSPSEEARDAVVVATADSHPGVRNSVCFLVERCTARFFGPTGNICVGSPEAYVRIAGERVREAYAKDKSFRNLGH